MRRQMVRVVVGFVAIMGLFCGGVKVGYDLAEAKFAYLMAQDPGTKEMVGDYPYKGTTRVDLNRAFVTQAEAPRDSRDPGEFTQRYGLWREYGRPQSGDRAFVLFGPDNVPIREVIVSRVGEAYFMAEYRPDGGFSASGPVQGSKWTHREVEPSGWVARQAINISSSVAPKD